MHEIEGFEAVAPVEARGVFLRLADIARADVEQTRGDREKERIARSEGWESASEDQRMNWGYQLVRRFFQMQAELSAEERGLAVRAGEQVFAAGEALRAERPGAVNMDVLHEMMAMALAIDGRLEEARRHGCTLLTTPDGIQELKPANGD